MHEGEKQIHWIYIQNTAIQHPPKEEAHLLLHQSTQEWTVENQLDKTLPFCPTFALNERPVVV